eukprot:510957_1
MNKCGCFVILSLWLAITTWSLDINTTAPTPNVSKPSILFILVDDLGWNDIGYHGSSDFTTPNIDNLATRRGLQLNNYYVNSLCTPTRAALLSGRYSIRTGMQHDLNPTATYGLPLQFTLLSQDLQRAGYDTYLFGKWHLGYFNEEYTPTFRGFDTFYGYYNGEESFLNHTVTVDYQGTTYQRYDLMDNTEPVNDAFLHTYSTFIYRNKTLDVLRQFSLNPDTEKQPFFIYLSLQNVHSPLQAPAEVVNSMQIEHDMKRKIKAAKATIVDDMIGDIVHELNDTGLWDNTLIIFTTDNGAPSEDGGSNFPLRGSKGTLWEGGIRGTAFVSGGYLHVSRYGQVSNELLHVTDFYPTLCEIAGINATDHADLDGKSFLPILQQEHGASQRDEVLLNIDPVGCNNTWNVCGAIRIGDWKLLVGNIGNQVTTLRDPHGAMDNICVAGWCTKTEFSIDEYETSLLPDATVQCLFKNITQQLDISSIYNTCPFNGEPCLFNITDDPCEFYDVKASNTDVFNQAMDRLKFWYTQMVTPLSTLNVEADPNDMPNNTHWMPWDRIPSRNPTMEPTLEPTMNPNAATANPTQSPLSKTQTLSPTQSPARSNIVTTQSPTLVPSKAPVVSNIVSTVSPSQLPTIAPITHITVAPTITPSNAPTPPAHVIGNDTVFNMTGYGAQDSVSFTQTIESAEQFVDLLFRVDFKFVNGICANASLSFMFEEIDFAQEEREFIDVFYPLYPSDKIAHCTGTQDYNCGTWITCFDRMALAQPVLDERDDSSTYRISVIKSAEVNTLCTYSIQAKVTMHCGPPPSPTTRSPSLSPTQKPTSSPVTRPPTRRPSTSTLFPTDAPTFAPTISPTAKRVVTEVLSKGKNEYMTGFYMVSILLIAGCLCVVCICVCYQRSKSRNTTRHRRLQDAIKGIELRTIIQRPPGGGEYSGLLN